MTGLDLARIAAEAVANTAQTNVGSLVQQATGASQPAIDAAVSKAVTQDPWYASKRLWTVIGAVLTAALASPEVQASLGPWAAVASSLATALLPLWSKLADPRPIR
jgi:hypothetical protein